MSRAQSSQATTIETITCKAKLYAIGDWTIFHLPKEASTKLPSRGQAMVEGTLNGTPLQTPLEPDGNWSHWFRVTPELLKACKVAAGDTVTLAITPVKHWPEPDMPKDLMNAIKGDPEIYALWQRITPMARWEWLRWTRATNSTETRSRRIEVACSKLRAGERRPCCWNRNMSTEPRVSKNGRLLAPDTIAK